MAQQLGHAEAQLAKIGEIDSTLHKLLERVDASPSPEEVASKAAHEAARLVADEAKFSAASAERLDTMPRDLVALGDRTRASDDKLAGTIEAVHASLKQLVQQMEKPAPQPAAPKPRVPFAERMRDLAPSEASATQASADSRAETGEMPKAGMSGAPAAALANAPLPKTPSPKDLSTKNAPPKDSSPRNRLAAAIADLDDSEAAPYFGRAKREPLEDKPFDLDAKPPRRETVKKLADAEYDVPDDLVAAARRAAQAAALKAEERSGGSRVRRLPGDANVSSAVELPSRRKRSFLIICAALLLALSALLLYGRLRSKPEPEVTAPATEQSAPAPSAPSQGSAAPGAEESAPPAAEPKAETPPATPDSSELQQEIDASPADNDVGDVGQSGNFTEVAKSSYRNASATEPLPQAQPAALVVDDKPKLPPGVVFSVEDPNLGSQAAAGQAAPALMPSSLPLPPPDLGPLSLRQAAAQGDARAQFAIGFRYVEGQGTPQNLTEAARWLERAASAGFAPAQYRLAVMYERGQGVAMDLGRARSWYQAAAEKGNVKAMHNLAVSLSGGAAGAADYPTAARWYGEAAAYGLTDSQFNLGILSEHGLGIPQDLSAAYQWFALAAKGGDQEAAKHRDLVKAQLDPAALVAAKQAVAAWKPKEAVSDANGVEELPEWSEGSATPNTALVSRAQNLLNKLGYDAGVADGLIGAQTRDAIKSFERKNGLEETGKVTIQLVAKLERLTS
jgi:localization factor PodJL